MDTREQSEQRTFVIADIHGEYYKLMALMGLLKEEANFDISKDRIVNLGDKNDRGPDTYKVMEYYRELLLMYPENVDLIWGNHEAMMVDAAQFGPFTEIFYIDCNGGKKTLQSYSQETGYYGKKSLGNSLVKTGHNQLLGKHLYFLETDKYFFCHAPIPKEVYRKVPPGFDFRCSIETLTYSCPEWPIEMEDWIDVDPCEGKLCVYGHVHGIQVKRVMQGRISTDEIVIPGVRRYGNAVLLDTGCGCADEGYLSCLELPAKKIYNSLGNVYDLEDLPDLQKKESQSWLHGSQE